jgi:hypothetical protein
LGAESAVVTPEEYCRELEAYLCRKNDGHLIRIVGPSFERVCRWADQGIPFRIACQGIDRYFVRYYAKGARRRPVHIDFCEADVLDAFDAWRRAVGVRLPGSDGDNSSRKRNAGMREHLDGVLERITGRLTSARPLGGHLKGVLETIADEVASFAKLAEPVRGEARTRVRARLTELDRLMLDAVRGDADPGSFPEIQREAQEELAPFRERMDAEAFRRALDLAIGRLLREHEKLPVLTI